VVTEVTMQEFLLKPKKNRYFIALQNRRSNNLMVLAGKPITLSTRRPYQPVPITNVFPFGLIRPRSFFISDVVNTTTGTKFDTSATVCLLLSTKDFHS